MRSTFFMPDDLFGASRARVFAWGTVAVLALPALWWSPVSPMALDRGDVLFGNGDAAAAVHHFDLVGRVHPMSATRIAANLRAATLSSTDLGSPSSARTYLRRVLEESATPATLKADAWERLGHVEWTAFSDPEEAAAAFQMAYRLDMLAPEAPRRLVAEARARTEAGDSVAALDAWERVAERVPEQAALARVSQASLLLASGDEVAALEAYEEAISRTSDPVLHQVARLGAATCKERMGDIAAAIDDLESAGLPDDVVLERQRRLEERGEGL